MSRTFESIAIGFGGDPTAHELLELALLSEKEGFGSLWIQERTIRWKIHFRNRCC
jgi:hypothetical protein